MSEEKVIKYSDKPITIKAIKKDLISLGIRKGMVLMLHSSLSSIGWVSGAAVSVILALEEVLGKDGSLVMPAFSSDLSDPIKWKNPAVPELWCAEIRETMPPFYNDLTPTRGMGVIPECFRKQSGVLRSNHPQYSFTAWGKYARRIVTNHSLSYGFGERSPLAKIYDLGGYILLIGVKHENNTSLHLAQYRANYPGKKEESSRAPVIVKGKRQWVEFSEVKYYENDFNNIGIEFVKKGSSIKLGNIGKAESQLFKQKDMVDFAVQWMEKNRK